MVDSKCEELETGPLIARPFDPQCRDRRCRLVGKPQAHGHVVRMRAEASPPFSFTLGMDTTPRDYQDCKNEADDRKQFHGRQEDPDGLGA